MEFIKENAVLFIPDNEAEQTALKRTTHLCIGAHQDDIEIMAFAQIAHTFGKNDKWFTGVTVTDGAGSPRSGIYKDYTDDDMKKIRVKEQNNAASIGGYSAQFQLGFSSKEVKDKNNENVIKQLADLIKACSADILFTHNLADKHDTHVAVALKVIAAVKSLPKEERPKKVYSLEVWRGLDWLCDSDKAVFDTSVKENLAAALLGVYDSQISGGKRYDLAAMGRRLSNATFFESHSVDDCSSMSFGLDITELFEKDLSPGEFISKYISNFKNEVTERLNKFS